MLILTAVQNTQPDYVALAMVVVLAIIVAIMAIRKKFSVKKETEQVVAPAAAEEAEKPAAPGSAGQVKIHGVEPKTAARLRAIVADKMGRPLNELRFISIREVE